VRLSESLRFGAERDDADEMKGGVTAGSRRNRLVMRWGTIVAFVSAVLSLAVPAEAATRSFGDMVDYDLTFPVDGDHEYTDTFWAWRSHGSHGSQDIFAEKGVPVVAAAGGTVRLVNWSRDAGLNPSRCCSVVIDHDDGWRSAYLHLTNDTPGTDDGKGWGVASGIAPGVRVSAGQLIGWVGDSGNAEETSPHLHFELYDADGVKVNSYAALVAAEQSAGGADLASVGVVQRGDAGDPVRELQERLRGLGFDVGPIDGRFGTLTEAAVVGFQAEHRLEVDGKVGSITKGAIAGLLRPDGSVLGFGRRSDAVAELQAELNEAGVDAGAADGIFGPRTLEAVIALQKAYELTVDGLVGPQTRGALSML
jgi:peptidoglycan hydrolase-like protein with peptidoglycan-binding domain